MFFTGDHEYDQKFKVKKSSFNLFFSCKDFLYEIYELKWNTFYEISFMIQLNHNSSKDSKKGTLKTLIYS